MARGSGSANVLDLRCIAKFLLRSIRRCRHYIIARSPSRALDPEARVLGRSGFAYAHEKRAEFFGVVNMQAKRGFTYRKSASTIPTATSMPGCFSLTEQDGKISQTKRGLISGAIQTDANTMTRVRSMAVARDRRGWLSPRWNYQSEFMAAVDPRKCGVEPAIWHSPDIRSLGTRRRNGSFQGYLLASTDLPESGALAEGLKHREKLRFRLRWIYPWRRISRAYIIHAALNRT